MEIEDLDATFSELARRRGYIVTDVGEELVRQGIDFHVQGIYRETNREVNMLFAVKRRKSKKKSKYLDRWTWIEYRRAGRKDGWVYGSAHFIAFERSNDFVVVSRMDCHMARRISLEDKNPEKFYATFRTDIEGHPRDDSN